MNDRKRLLNRISATQFAAWELHMYLDTHPCDRTANEMFRKYTDEAKMLRREYESKYGPLTISASNEADWLNDPWPWENERSCD
jgi:spore coat protein JB